MKIPAGLVGVLRLVRQIVASITILDHDLAMRPEIVGAQEELCASREQDVAILEQAAKRDISRVVKCRAACPRSGVVLGQTDLPVAETEGSIVALRVDVWPFRCKAKPEVFGLTNCGLCGAQRRNGATLDSGSRYCRGR